MNKQPFNLNNLRIASPCSVKWETMSGDERRRFCSLCQLSVYDFSGMSANDVRRLIERSEGRICGRLYQRSDRTILIKDCPVGLRAYQKRIGRFAGAALAMILGLFSVSFGQKKEEKSIDGSKLVITRKANSVNILSGTIVDPAGAVIGDAEIRLIKGKNPVNLVRSNGDGDFFFLVSEKGKYALQVSAPGFESLTVQNIEVSETKKSRINIMLRLDVGEALLGVVVTADEPEITNEPLRRPPVINKKLN